MYSRPALCGSLYFQGDDFVKKFLAGLVASAAVLTTVPTAQAVTASEAKSDALYYAKNNCPRPGSSSTYKCLKVNGVEQVSIMDPIEFYGPGVYRTTVANWECWKIDPFCDDRKSARRGGTIRIQINNNGSVTALSGWRNFQ